MFPLDQGFCELKLEPLFIYFAIGFYLIVFLPCILYTLFKLGMKFPYMKIYICSIIVSAVLLVVHIAMVTMTSFRCSSLVENVPADIAFLLFGCVFSYTQVITPIINLVIIKIKVMRIESNKKNLIKVLNSNLLYDEFLAYCEKKCCGEYALFHNDYMKFRRTYKLITSKAEGSQFFSDSSEFFNSTASMSCISVTTTNNQISTNFEVEPDGDTTSVSDKKRRPSTGTGADKASTVLRSMIETHSVYVNDLPEPSSNGPNNEVRGYFERVYRIINDIYTKYFEKESPLELNIADRIVKKIKKNLQNFNESYNRMVVNQSFTAEGLNCERMYDEAYREAIETLYHNVFNNYLAHKKNDRLGSELKDSRDVIVDPDNVSIKRSLV